jgi:hypothetical protein
MCLNRFRFVVSANVPDQSTDMPPLDTISKKWWTTGDFHPRMPLGYVAHKLVDRERVELFKTAILQGSPVARYPAQTFISSCRHMWRIRDSSHPTAGAVNLD